MLVLRVYQNTGYFSKWCQHYPKIKEERKSGIPIFFLLRLFLKQWSFFKCFVLFSILHESFAQFIFMCLAVNKI